MTMNLNPVDRYAFLLASIIESDEREHSAVKQIRGASTEEEAVKFFKTAVSPPSIGRWLFYSQKAQREAITTMQNYIKASGMEFPAPSKLVQRFLDGGKYPGKKNK